MEEPTMEEVLELVEFDRDKDGNLRVKKVRGNVWGNVQGYVWGNVMDDVKGDVRGYVRGKISGREWQYVETPKERAIRLIREGKGDEAIKVLEEE